MKWDANGKRQRPAGRRERRGSPNRGHRFLVEFDKSRGFDDLDASSHAPVRGHDEGQNCFSLLKHQGKVLRKPQKSVDAPPDIELVVGAQAFDGVVANISERGNTMVSRWGWRASLG